MRSSAIIALAALAAAPVFSAPLPARGDDESGAVQVGNMAPPRVKGVMYPARYV